MKMKKRHIIAVLLTATTAFGLLVWGAATGSEVMGYITAPGTAAITASGQTAAAGGTVTIDEVLSPEAAFVVVHQEVDGKPGTRLGVAPVPAGTSRDVKVTLDSDAEMTEKIIAAVHADRGVAGELEFDMEDIAASPDRPYFVDGAEVATVIALR